MKLSIPQMSCGHCKATVETAVKSLDPAAQIAIDLGSRSAEIGTSRSVAEVTAALKTAGYEATSV